MPMNHVIHVALEVHAQGRKALPCSVDAFADSGCSYPLLLSGQTWSHVAEHFADTISSCNERVALAVGELRMTERASVFVRLRLSDGSVVEAPMFAYKSDTNLLGLIGLESLGLLVDAPRKCLKRAIMLAGTHHFVCSGAENGCQAKREGPPPASLAQLRLPSVPSIEATRSPLTRIGSCQRSPEVPCARSVDCVPLFTSCEQPEARSHQRQLL